MLSASARILLRLRLAMNPRLDKSTYDIAVISPIHTGVPGLQYMKMLLQAQAVHLSSCRAVWKKLHLRTNFFLMTCSEVPSTP